ncbi:ribonuclease P protein subunit [Acidianus hospitalis]|jgi:ribonuclease P protein subunit POP4|uniref:Ribonuclease P protein component 1 n=1 Tax=Acidianus hospitalis (strain W1) TaxID=933801 RepID=F4B8D9_ACIHW|nr:ribonuclease P protein subunit [Acidianus hospitalis]AEE93738.1 archaeal RNase P subunit p29 [Acidianus hospitalis W1]MDT7900478.1 ribonuclease P protein subunit [Acidianus sp.]
MKRPLDLIGLKVKVLSHSNPFFIGLSGVIVFESSKFLYIKSSKGKILMVYKADGIFEIDFKGSHQIMHGYKLMGNIVKRLKKRWTK